MNRYTAREIVEKTSDIPRSARLLYTILDEYARSNGFCFLKHVTLMNHLKCSKRSLQYWLAKLAEAGFIGIERSKTGGVNRYHMAWFSGTVRNESQSVARGGVQKAARGGANGGAPSILNTSSEYSTDELRSENQHPSREAPPVCPDLCRSCRGTGTILIQAIGWTTCTPCRGSGQTKTVSIGAKTA